VYASLVYFIYVCNYRLNRIWQLYHRHIVSSAYQRYPVSQPRNHANKYEFITKLKSQFLAYATRHPSPVNCVICRMPPVNRHPSHVIRHMSTVTRQPSHPTVTRHSSTVTHHQSHVIRYVSHANRYMLAVTRHIVLCLLFSVSVTTTNCPTLVTCLLGCRLVFSLFYFRCSKLTIFDCSGFDCSRLGHPHFHNCRTNPGL
jgi:hypothetical protein